jgi:uncharacterized protein
MPRLPPRKICSRCGFSKEESESLCQRCRNGQEPYLTYVRTSSRCAKCGGVKNHVEQICEYCRNAQELSKIIRPLRPTVPLHEQVNINKWGKELYTDKIPVTAQEVNLLDVAFRPEGSALCLFYGPTPISKPNKIEPYSPVNIVGHIVTEQSNIINRIKTATKVIINQA